MWIMKHQSVNENWYLLIFSDPIFEPDGITVSFLTHFWHCSVMCVLYSYMKLCLLKGIPRFIDYLIKIQWNLLDKTKWRNYENKFPSGGLPDPVQSHGQKWLGNLSDTLFRPASHWQKMNVLTTGSCSHLLIYMTVEVMIRV